MIKTGYKNLIILRKILYKKIFSFVKKLFELFSYNSLLSSEQLREEKFSAKQSFTYIPQIDIEIKENIMYLYCTVRNDI